MSKLTTATYDPVLEVFRLIKQRDLIEMTISMIRKGDLYIHFMKRDEVFEEFCSSLRDVNKAIDIYIKEIEDQVPQDKKVA